MKPLASGGLGLKNFEDINSSMRAKLAWGLLAHDGLCFSALGKIFIPNEVPNIWLVNSSIWNSIRCVYDTLWSNCKWFVGKSSFLNFSNHEWLVPPLSDQLNITRHNKMRL